MDDQRLASAVPEGEGLRYVDDTRSGGAVGFTDERLLVVRDDGSISIELSSVESVEFQDLDWFEAVLGLAVLAFGLVSTTRSVPLGLLFAAVGLASLALTYRRRNRVAVSVHGRPKPLTLHPADFEGFQRAFERALHEYRTRHDREPARP